MNLILYHKFFDICIIEVRLNLMEANKPLGFVHFHRIQSGRNNRYIKKIVIETQIYSGSKINLLIMIGRTRDRRARLNPHLLTSGLIMCLLAHLSLVNSFFTWNKSGSLIIVIIIFFTFIYCGGNALVFCARQHRTNRRNCKKEVACTRNSQESPTEKNHIGFDSYRR
jgi:hypothetical protein